MSNTSAQEARIKRIASAHPPEEREFVSNVLRLRNKNGEPLDFTQRTAILRLINDPIYVVRDYALYEQLIIAPQMTLTRALHEIGWEMPVPPTFQQLEAAIRLAAAQVQADDLRKTPSKTLRPSWDT